MDYVNIAAKTSAFQGEGTIYFQYPHSKDSMTCSFENGVKNGNAVLFANAYKVCSCYAGKYKVICRRRAECAVLYNMHI